MTIALTARHLPRRWIHVGDRRADLRGGQDACRAPFTIAVKEDVVMPLFRRFGSLSVAVLRDAPAQADTVKTLVKAFSTEVATRGELESTASSCRS